MKKIIFLVFLIMLLTTIMGCTLQGPESNPSFSILPEVLLDYDFDENEVDIWVKSAISDYKYNNITIEISKDDNTWVIQDNYTYCVYTSSELNSFKLKIIVNGNEKSFGFESEVDVDLLREDLIIITTYDDLTAEANEERVAEDDLPYKKILNEI